MSEGRYILRERQGEIAVLTLNNETANPFVPEMHAELSEVLEGLGRDDTVLGVVITGRGKFFSAGANISRMVEFDQTAAREFGEAGQRTFRILEDSRFVTVAAVNGVAAGGGCELSLACDFRVASAKALFGQPEVNIGAIPGWGGCRRLTRVVGYPKALSLILTGDLIPAERALAIGLVESVVPEGESVLDAGLSLCRRVTARSPRAISDAKRALRAGLELGRAEAEAVELQGFAAAFGRPDREEGMRAFLERRPAAFSRKF